MENGQNAVSVIECLKNKRYSREHGAIGGRNERGFGDIMALWIKGIISFRMLLMRELKTGLKAYEPCDEL